MSRDYDGRGHDPHDDRRRRDYLREDDRRRDNSDRSASAPRLRDAGRHDDVGRPAQQRYRQGHHDDLGYEPRYSDRSFSHHQDSGYGPRGFDGGSGSAGGRAHDGRGSGGYAEGGHRGYDSSERYAERRDADYRAGDRGDYDRGHGRGADYGHDREPDRGRRQDAEFGRDREYGRGDSGGGRARGYSGGGGGRSGGDPGSSYGAGGRQGPGASYTAITGPGGGSSGGYGGHGRDEGYGGGGRYGFQGGRGGGRGGFQGGRGGGRGGGGGNNVSTAEGTDKMVRVLATPDATLCAPARQPVPAADPDAPLARPDRGGVIGRAVQVHANYFQLRLRQGREPRPAAIQFDVDIEVVKEQTALQRQQEEGAGGGAARQPRVNTPKAMLPSKVTITVMKFLMDLSYNIKPGPWSYDGQRTMYMLEDAIPQGLGAEGGQDTQEVDLAHPADYQEAGLRSRTRFNVTLKRAAEVDLRGLPQPASAAGVVAAGGGGGGRISQEALRVLDIMLRHPFMSSPNVIMCGKGFYDASRVLRSITGGVDLHPGFVQTVKACEAGLALAVDTAVAAFVGRKTLAVAVCELAGGSAQELARGWSTDRAMRKLALQTFKEVKVTYPMPSGKVRKAEVRGFTDQGADRSFFEGKEGRRLSVAQYFAETNRPLVHPGLPCIIIGKKGAWVPIEVCDIMPGQRKGVLSSEQTSEMIAVAKQDPATKLRDVTARAQEVNAVLRASHLGPAWGADVEEKPLAVRARLLPSPALEYRDQAGQLTAFDVQEEGSWNLRGIRFLSPARLGVWCAVSVVGGGEEHMEGGATLRLITGKLCGMMRQCGMELTADPRHCVHVVQDERRPLDIKTLIQEAVDETRRKTQGAKPELIFVLLHSKRVEPHIAVKLACDTELGIPSQCMTLTAALGLGKKARGGGGGGGSPNPTYLANVAMKVNVKLGGVNTRLLSNTEHMPVLGGLDAPPFCVLGADITHPEGGAQAQMAGGSGPPSVAAIVASLDSSQGRYATRLLVQHGREDIIQGMEPSVAELLAEYRARQPAGGAPLPDRRQRVALGDADYDSREKWERTPFAALPARILMYRDGVSDGEFERVKQVELDAIRRACAALHPDYRPRLAFVVVKKRHATRLFPAGPDAADRSGNVRPGTVVDSAITSGPTGFDFFLNSHAGLQGTNRPAHYWVLADEVGFGSDGIQLLTYWWCYTYQRATKAVSVCPPAYYAHLAAFRGRALLAAAEAHSGSASDAGSMGSGRGGRGGARHEEVTGRLVHRALCDRLFFL